MRLTFLTEIKPAPKILRLPTGTLYAFGEANFSWERVGEILSAGGFPDAIRGGFAFVWEGKDETVAAVDHVATFPLFYTERSISHIFHELLLATPEARPNPRTQFEIRYLGGQTFRNDETTYHEIRRILPGHRLFRGRHSPYIDLLDYAGDEALDPRRFTALVEERVERLARDENALLLSGGTDSVALAGIIKKLGLEKKFSFVHAYSGNQPLTETHLVERIAREMEIEVRQVRIDFSGDVVPSQSGRQFSFWVENPFPAKRLATELAGCAGKRIFTGELGDQLFGGPKNPALLNYAFQSGRLSAEEIAALWVNLSASYGRNHGFRIFGKITESFEEAPEAREVYQELVASIAALFRRMRTKDLLNRFMLMNFLVKGPYRTWSYSQDEFDWVHPFAGWEIFDYAFRLRACEKIGAGGMAKSVLLRTWKPYLSPIPWSVPKHGFGIPARSKLRA